MRPAEKKARSVRLHGRYAHAEPPMTQICTILEVGADWGGMLKLERTSRLDRRPSRFSIIRYKKVFSTQKGKSMSPRKVTIESEREEKQKNLCDEIQHRAAVMMVEEVGVSVPMMLDRVLTFAAAQCCVLDGSTDTAAHFRLFADRIEAGLFHPVTGEGKQGH